MKVGILKAIRKAAAEAVYILIDNKCTAKPQYVVIKHLHLTKWATKHTTSTLAEAKYWLSLWRECYMEELLDIYRATRSNQPRYRRIKL